jgi:flagellar protein FlgJ
MNLPSNRVALDSRGLDDLKRTARESPDKALKAAATQFEALFMNMILKSMRDGLPKDGLTSSSAGDTYTGMLDQQLSQKLAGQGTGLADMLVKQLGRSMQPPGAKGVRAADGTSTPAAPVAGNGKRSATNATAARARSPLALDLNGSASTAMSTPGTQRTDAAARVSATSASERKRDFVARMADHAKAAEQKTGVPARFMIGQAALESGWGRKEIKDGSGQSAHNVFGIKATGNWRGPTVDVTTTEFVDGVAKKVVEKFRAYASYAEGFADYAKVIANNPRYANVLKTARHGIESFAQGLQRAGYATDPAYATKLARVINDAVQIDRQA